MVRYRPLDTICCSHIYVVVVVVYHAGVDPGKMGIIDTVDDCDGVGGSGSNTCACTVS